MSDKKKNTPASNCPTPPSTQKKHWRAPPTTLRAIMALRRSLPIALRLLSSRAAGPSPHSATAPPLAAAAARAPFSSSSSPPPAEDESLDQIRARIFGTHVGDGRSTGRKLLRSALAGPAVAAWYPPEIVDPLFLDVDDTR